MKGETAVRCVRPIAVACCLALCSCAPRQAMEPVGSIWQPPAGLDVSQVSLGEGREPLGSSVDSTNRPQADGSALALSLQSAVLMALRSNASFQVERLRPAIRRTEEQIESAAFDPTLSASATADYSTDKGDADEVGEEPTDSDSVTADVRMKKALPAGTALELAVGSQR